MGADMQLSERIGRRMKLQDLHVLMTVMQAGSMGKAGKLLNISQPARSPNWSMRSVSACSIVTGKGSKRPNTAAHCSIAGWPYSMTYVRA
jgi:hypothetical protein